MSLGYVEYLALAAAAGLAYAFVPSVHAWVLKIAAEAKAEAQKAEDDLFKLKAEGQSLIARYVTHAEVQTAAAVVHTEAAAVSTAAATAASSAAAEATKLADGLKSIL